MDAKLLTWILRVCNGNCLCHLFCSIMAKSKHFYKLTEHIDFNTIHLQSLFDVCVDVPFCCTRFFWCGSWWCLARHLQTIAADVESRMLQIHMIYSCSCLRTSLFLRFDRCIYTSSANREKFSNQVRPRSCAPVTCSFLTIKSTVSHLMITIISFLLSVIARLFREFHGWHHHC